ncbi:MAG: CBS domain-containing protein, partial [Chitinophagaceae bacterium]|nr:CBS domain-containing protein [Chitinophagaceae bacterium]
GGNLGKRLYLRVSDLCANNAKPKVLETATLKEVIVEISKSRLGVTAVVNASNKIIGIITDGDLRRMLENMDSLLGVTAENIFAKNPKTIGSSVLAVEALELLRSNDISQLLVEEDGIYVGVLHLHDLIREGIV